MTIDTSVLLCIDIVIIAFYIIMIIFGVKKGFLVQLVSLLGLIVAILLAWYFSPVLADFFDLWPHNWLVSSSELIDGLLYEQINSTAWFILLVIVFKLLFLLLKPLTKLIQKVPIIKQLSALLGGVFSFLIATAWIMLVCLVLNMNFISNGNEIVEKTLLAPIRNTTLVVFHDLEEPFAKSQAVSKFISGSQDLTDSDRTYLKKWFIENGLDDLPIEEFTQQGSNPSASPEVTLTPSSSPEIGISSPMPSAESTHE